VADHAEPTEGLIARWRELSPVRLALYPVLLAVVALLVGYGVIDGERAALWIAAGTALLGISGVEAARKVAWSPATVTRLNAEWTREATEWQAHSVDEYARGARDALHATPDANGARCRDIRGGSRCLLELGHEGVHLIPTN
jgi:hypothetical protein